MAVLHSSIESSGKPVELIRLDPYWTPVIRHVGQGEPTYEVTEKGETRILSWRDVIHIPSPSVSRLVWVCA